ncbi:hypothetical protein [Chromobacterium subtsugae]|uniref:hypothetical protein n=1 Tax=Chromobacterium subtsugae TaxID=251747 RepID=UPI000640C387|nr:hypothetical protein [Chromobacterium subtsugae]
MNDAFAPEKYSFSPGQTIAQVSHGNDTGLYVEFHTEAVHQPFESQQEGRPIFSEIPFITILFPGDKTKKVVRPVKLQDDEAGPSDLRRFPNQWAAFKQEMTQHGDGIPLEQWPQISKVEVAELKALNIHTVDQLAALADGNLSWLGGRQLRDRARTWLEAAAGNAPMARMQSELEARDNTITRMEQSMAAMQAQIEDLQNKLQEPRTAAEAAESTSRRSRNA